MECQSVRPFTSLTHCIPRSWQFSMPFNALCRYVWELTE